MKAGSSNRKTSVRRVALVVIALLFLAAMISIMIIKAHYLIEMLSK